MKKKMIISSFVFSLMMLLGTQVNAQKFSGLDKSPLDVAAFPTDYKDANKLIKIVYSRPQLNERSLDKLTDKGKVWRFGANEAAELTLYTDMKLGGKTIKAGSYMVAAITGDKEWTIIINSDLNTWGSYFYNEEKDVARITVPVTMASESLEAFSIVFSEGKSGVDMNIGWDKVRVVVPFTK